MNFGVFPAPEEGVLGPPADDAPAPLKMKVTSEHSIFRDAATGRLVHQMTSAAAINHATYFLQSSFTPGDEAMIFISDRSGSFQLFEINPFPLGAIRQITDGPPIHAFSPAIRSDGRTIYFVRGAGLWELDRGGLAERRIVEFEGAQLGEPSLSADGWAVMAIKQHGASGLAVGKVDGSAWSVIPFPRTVIHPQFHPTEPEWIEFSGDPAPRMHRVRRDGSDMECLFAHGNDHFIVHETFLGATGNLVYTVWPKALCVMEWKTRRRHIITGFNAWHITPNRAGTKILCDTNHPDRGIFLIDAVTGARELVCLSQSSNQGSQWRTSRYALTEDFAAARWAAKSEAALSWMEVGADTVYGPQWTHPHPSFSSDESKAVFTSDQSGWPQVYVAELAD